MITEITDTDALNILKNTNQFDISAEDTMSEENLLKNIGKYDAIMVRTYTIITKEVIDAAKNLKLIVRAGVGLDNIDVKYAKEKGIEVRNTPKANYLSVAEHVIALMQSLLRNIPQADR
ncbi:MAG: phosphoglycerate dehydrogenase, partial [Candidatus Aenigmarchaeota archaeon]|nr:phosphoglycerate dehydrogenase [Candidatus Aenigmarchaeota archaeon]